MLHEIMNYKLAELSRLDRSGMIDKIKSIVPLMNPVKSFEKCLKAQEEVTIIAEIKRRSPSKGDLAPDLPSEKTARAYERAGAGALSVLTESEFFGGSVNDLIDARHCTKLPILRKDFIIDAFQIWESRLIGADAVLLIAALLDAKNLDDLFTLSKEIGLEVLIEIHDEEDLTKALDIGPQIIGINNRDLKTLTVDLSTTESLRALIPDDIVCVSESGIKSRHDMIRLRNYGVDAALIGEELVTSADPFAKIQKLRGVENGQD